MVRDLIIDILEKDLILEDKSNAATPVFDTIWGNIFKDDTNSNILICNIIIPSGYMSSVNFDENGEYMCKFTSAYIPDTSHFFIRLVALRGGEYLRFSTIRGELGMQACSYVLNKNIAAPLPASMLMMVDSDGEYIARFVKNSKSEALDKAYIYSSKMTDISIQFSDAQSAYILAKCSPGNSYRYPTTGVGITSYINSVVSYTTLSNSIEEQFLADKKPIQDASFDNETGDFDVIYNHEKEVEDEGLLPISSLNVDFFSAFDDMYVRRNIVLRQVTDIDYIKLLNEYDNFLEIVFFQDETTMLTRIADEVVMGMFDAEGSIVESSEYLIVSATMEANSIIMFNDEEAGNITDAPVFIVNGYEDERLYTALVEQPYWINENCYKCMVLNERAVIRYMIHQSQFNNGKGLYVIPQTSENIKNLLGIAQDKNTGRILGIVSNNTNISDVVLEEISQHIYAQINHS